MAYSQVSQDRTFIKHLGEIVKYLNWDAIHKLIKLFQMDFKEKFILPILQKQKQAKGAEKGEIFIETKKSSNILCKYL